MVEISLKHRFEYSILRGLATLIRCLSRERALRLGGRLGLLGGMLFAKRRKLAEDNLRRAFPDWGPQRVRTISWANFQHIGICAAEMLRLDLFRGGKADLERYFELVDLQHLHDALKLGKGAILLTGHLGFWEAGFFVMPTLGIPVDAVAKPLKNRWSDVYFRTIRESFGAGTIDSRHGVRKILKSLQQQRTVAILLDQHISPPGSVATRFFGRQGYTTTAITNLAMRHQVPVVPMFCQRLPDSRYKVWAEPMLLLEGAGEQAVEDNTQRLTDIIERAVRRDPSQWFWMHKRWRVAETQPAAKSEGKDK